MQRFFLWCLPCLFAVQAHAQSLSAQACTQTVPRNAAEARKFLADRAANIIGRARATGWRQDRDLQAMVSPSASASLLFGDSGSRFDDGVEGIRALASHINGTTYRYLKHAGYAEGPFNPCADQPVKVEFTDDAAHVRIDITFVFHADALMSATGLQYDFEEGRLKPAD